MRLIRHGTARILAVIVTMVLAAACANGGGRQDEGEIVIGASAPLSGVRSEGGQAVKRGYQVWQELVNESGGMLGRRVRIELHDDGSDPNRTRANYQALIDRDRVDVLLGTFTSLQNEPASAVAEQRRMLYVCPSCGAPELFARNFDYYYFFFAQPAVSDHQADLFARWVASLPARERPRTAAYPVIDDPFAQPIVASLRTQLEAVGIKTVYAGDPYPDDLDSLTSIANAIKAAKPDLIAHGAGAPDGILMTRALMQVDYNPKIMFQTTSPSLGEQYADGVGAANTVGIFYAVSWSPAATFEQNQEFVGRYEAAFGQVPPEDAANAFGAAQVVQAAIEGVGGVEDQTALADWLHDNPVETVMGPISWDAAGRPQQAFVLAQWQQVDQPAGHPPVWESRVVLPREVADADEIIHPKPNWATQ